MSLPRERILLTTLELEDIEIDILNRRHIERYALIRQFLYGVVLDASCGCGYGSHLISKNPDIEEVIGIDIAEYAIHWAKEHFQTEKTRFLNCSFETFNEKHHLHKIKADVLVSLETIEHLKHPEVLNELAENCDVKEIFISYPSKKTTHYNNYHFRDFIDDEIIRIFKNYKLVDVIDLHREVRILKLEKYVSSI